MSPPGAAPYRVAASVGLMAWHLQTYWLWYCKRLAAVDHRDVALFFLLQLPTLVPAFLLLADLQLSSLHGLALLVLGVLRRAVGRLPGWQAVAAAGQAVLRSARRVWDPNYFEASGALGRSVAAWLRAARRLAGTSTTTEPPSATTPAPSTPQPDTQPLPCATPDLLRVVLLPEPRAPEPAPSEDRACIVCLTHARAVCAVPCGHAHFCYQCLLGQIVNVRPCCPSCNGPIREVIYARGGPSPGPRRPRMHAGLRFFARHGNRGLPNAGQCTVFPFCICLC
eukprot:EG_transcript_13737